MFLRNIRLKYSEVFWFIIQMNSALFHHQLATGIENVKFREVNVDLLPGTSSGK